MCVKQSAGNNSISHRYREMIKACVEAATHEVQKKPYGEVVKYVVRAASVVNQVVNDKAYRFPHINDAFMDEGIKESISAASEFIESDKMGTRFDLEEPALSTVCDSMFFNEAYVARGRESLSQKNYLVRENNWFVFFQEYSGRIPGTIGTQDLDEGGLIMFAKMSLEFAKCVGYGLRTHNSDLEIIYQRNGLQGERPKFLDMFDVVGVACNPPGSDLEEPLSFAIFYFQAYAGAIDMMRRYLIYSEDRLVKSTFHWSNVLRPDLGMTAKEFIKNVVATFHEPQSLGGLQLIQDCIPLTWNQLSVEQGFSSECAKKRDAAKQRRTIIDDITLKRPEDRPKALMPGDGLYHNHKVQRHTYIELQCIPDTFLFRKYGVAIHGVQMMWTRWKPHKGQLLLMGLNVPELMAGRT